MLKLKRLADSLSLLVLMANYGGVINIFEEQD
ncbi:hypothetical protein LCGC14_1758220, partial [marine sediment metagenome]